MAYSKDKKAELLSTYTKLVNSSVGRQGASIREAATHCGVPASTAQRWIETAETQSPETGSQGTSLSSPASLYPSAVEEREVVSDLLTQSGSLLKGIRELPSSKERLEQASAVDKLLSKYLAMLGRAEDGKEDSGADTAQLTALLASFGLGPSTDDLGQGGI